jgi:hypothetical protein
MLMEKIGVKNSNNLSEGVIVSTRIRKVRDIEDNSLILGGLPP